MHVVVSALVLSTGRKPGHRQCASLMGPPLAVPCMSATVNMHPLRLSTQLHMTPAYKAGLCPSLMHAFARSRAQAQGGSPHPAASLVSVSVPAAAFVDDEYIRCTRDGVHDHRRTFTARSYGGRRPVRSRTDATYLSDRQRSLQVCSNRFEQTSTPPFHSRTCGFETSGTSVPRECTCFG